MSFTTNSSNLSGKSTTNAFDIIANSLTVNKNTLCKGDLTVLGTTNIGNVSLENGFVNNLTVNNFTATNPVPITSGGTGLATIGSPNQVLTVNPAGTSLIYQAAGLINPATITGTGFTGNPTLSLGIEADTGSLGRGFIRTGLAATSGLLLGTVNATVLRLWSNFSTDSNAEIINTNANFTYNSTGTAGVFQVLNGGGGISFTNSGIGTISMGTAGGSITLADPTSISGAVNISTAGGIFNLSTGAGSTNITTVAGNLNLTTGIGALSLTTGAGNISLTTVGAGIISLLTATAGAINIGTTVGLVNLYGSAVTIGAPIIYIGTGSAVPIPSILTFACGAVTGITGAWTITTLGFQLNALSISLNSTGTIALNNSTTVGGDLTVTGGKATCTGLQQLATATSLHSFINTATEPTFTTATLSPNMILNSSVFTAIGKAISASNCTFLSFDNSTVPESRWSIYNSSTLIKQVNNGNITLQAPATIVSGNLITPQNIISGVQIINNGNVTLTVSSEETILIRGGSGSTITLPDATTLIIGYSYTINNNSSNPAIVNRFTSGTVGTISAGNCAVVTVFDISSANGQWDIHISGAQGATDWANPGTIGSITPNTGAFTDLTAGKTTLTAFANQATATSLYTFINTATEPTFTTSTLAPNMITNSAVFTAIGKAISTSNCAFLSFDNFALSQARWSIYNSTTSIRQIHNGAITLTSPTTELTGTLNVINGNAAIGSAATNFASLQLNGITGSYIDFSVFGVDYKTRIITTNSTSSLQYIANNHQFDGISTALASGILKVNNSSTAIQSHMAHFLQPTLGVMGAAQEDTNITFGKSNTANLAAQLQFGFTSGVIPFDNPFTTWGFYGLSGTKIQLRSNPNLTQTNVEITGNTLISGSSTVSTTGVLNVQNSSTVTSTVASFLSPNIGTLTQTRIVFGKDTSSNNSARLGYLLNTAFPAFTETTWSFYDGIGGAISLYKGGTISISGATEISGVTKVVGSTLVSSSGILNVENTSSATSTTATFLAPNLASTSQTQIVIGKNTSSSNAVILSYQLNTVIPSLTYSTWKFFDGIGGSISLLKGNSVSISGQTQINGNLTATNLKNGSRLWNSTTTNVVNSNTWTSIDFIFLAKQKGNGNLDWVDQFNGFKNQSDRALSFTCSFACKRQSNSLGVTAIRLNINNGLLVLGTQDVTSLDAVSISASHFLEPNDTLQCQIYQDAGIPVPYADIIVTINFTTFYEV